MLTIAGGVFLGIVFAKWFGFLGESKDDLNRLECGCYSDETFTYIELCDQHKN